MKQKKSHNTPKRRTKTKKKHPLAVPITGPDEMIKTLMSPDKDGNPTFKWARQAYKNSDDWVTIPAPDNPTNMTTVWCPSRTIALAILLTTPLSGTQVRWLCEGLMDKYVYDLKKEKMAKNTHPLKNFLYANGKTHEEQFGRPSGILQTEENQNFDQTDRESCLFINTNKTQLYHDQDEFQGYTMPWPDGKKFLKSEDAATREKGKWLARIYVLISYQLKWLQKYDPNPVPISFYDIPENRDQFPNLESQRPSFPRFVHLFRNLSNLNMVSCKINGKLSHATPPITQNMLINMLHKLAAATERRLRDKGMHITLTKQTKRNSKPQCLYNIRSLQDSNIARVIELRMPICIVEKFLTTHQSRAILLHYLAQSPQFVKERILKEI
jgi:Putative integrase